MSLKKISEKAGVAISTVSHVLNGTAKISDEVRERVLAVANEIGYLDSRRKRAMPPSLRRIALVVKSERLLHTSENYVSWTILDTLRKECADRKIDIEPIMLDEAADDYHQVIEQIKSQKCDGILVYFDEDRTLLDQVLATGMPCLLLAGQDPIMHVGSVGIGDRNGARLGVEYLKDLGHKNICIVTWPGRYTIRQRQDGFKEAIREYSDHDLNGVTILLESFRPEVAQKGMLDWLDVNPDLQGLTAFFCMADNIALGALKAFQQRGIKVPQDVSLLGFDDILAGQMTSPPLSTIHTPLHHIAKTALEELEQLARETHINAPIRKVELGCRLIARRTCRDIS
ncbi:LacI family DNA-binding transcriptional regulator [Marinomonas sp. THO17]|uniref:LacI family DNA-binding transcriptional regulator n=1 Tax=Marinomonas sp. THO17 TaxID=3149048 RepID=UPI00336BC4D7